MTPQSQRRFCSPVRKLPGLLKLTNRETMQLRRTLGCFRGAEEPSPGPQEKHNAKEKRGALLAACTLGYSDISKGARLAVQIDNPKGSMTAKMHLAFSRGGNED